MNSLMFGEWHDNRHSKSSGAMSGISSSTSSSAIQEDDREPLLTTRSDENKRFIVM
jgi:hypothetical protein